MAKSKNSTDVHSELRKKAEEKLKNVKQKLEHLTSEEAEHLVHELSVHQIELEMQNEELRNAQQELEKSRHDYAELFDNAPVGYLVFDRKGVVEKVNLTAARMLRIEKDKIETKPFLTFLPEFSSTGFFEHLEKVYATKAEQVCVIEIKRPDSSTFWAKFMTIPAEDAQGNFIHFITGVIDITEMGTREP